MKTLGLIGAALASATLLALLVGWSLFTDYLTRPASAEAATQAVVFEVGPSDTPEAVTASLAARSLIARPDWFEVYLRTFRRSAVLMPGEYELSPALTPFEIADRLHRGAVRTYTVTVRPGMRLAEIFDALDRLGAASKTDLTAFAEAPATVRSLDVPSTSLEGFVGVDNYPVRRKLGAAEAVRTLVGRFHTPAYDKLRTEARGLGLPELDWVTVASLLETSGLPEREWGRLAGLYWNRVRDGLALEHRGALAYGLGRSLDTLTDADLEADHPYNTFVRVGLPPTPVGAVSLAALQAAKDFAGDARYVAMKDDGTYHYCPDEECHRLALEAAGKPALTRRAGARDRQDRRDRRPR